jgi:hypothetical protein
MPQRSLKKHLADNAVVIAIVLLGFALRLFGVTHSVTDWHAFRQADTASVTREYVKHGIDVLRPHYHDLGNTQSGKENPQGYRMVEFPIINALLATLLRAAPFLNLVTTSRFASIIFSLGTIFCIYELGKRWANQTVAYFAALSFSVLPYAVFYSRVILPEPFFVFFLTFTILTFDYWLEGKAWKWYIASLISFSLALLLKPFALFFAPVLAYLALRHFKAKVFLQPALYLYIASVIPLFIWRNWIQQFPEGIPASDWLYNKDGIRLRPAWFRWLGWERYTKMILGGTGLIASFFSLFTKNKLRDLILVWGGCVLAYLIVIAGGNVQHDYYQSITLPIVCLALGQGLFVISQWKDPKKLLGLWLTAVLLIVVISRFPEPGFTPQFQVSPLLFILGASLGIFLVYLFAKKRNTRVAGISVAIGFLITAVIVSHWFVSGYYRTRPDFEQAGAAVQRLTPPEAKIIAPQMTDTMLLFQTDRVGWALGGEIDEKIQQGASYYVSTAYDDEAKELEQKYPVIEKTPNHIIIKLSQ